MCVKEGLTEFTLRSEREKEKSDGTTMKPNVLYHTNMHTYVAPRFFSVITVLMYVLQSAC